MKKIIFIGPQRAGKSTLTHLLNQNDLNLVHKTLVPEYCDDILDTPGEYIEHSLYFGRYQVLVADYYIVGLVIPCILDNIYIPPNFVSMFPNKKHLGIITKIDLATPQDIKNSYEFLHEVGIDNCIQVSMFNPYSIDALQKKIISIINKK